MNDELNLQEALFEQALKCASPEARAVFLAEACRGQPELRAQLDLLLEGHFMGQGFLEGAAEMRQLPADQHVGAIIGRYKLLERIGEGGFGVVYQAEQREPVKRRVALKIIKPGMDTKQVIARFEAERQALALMDHPGIARVFDGGATETGRPYFVMELVSGVPITTYCNEQQLSTEERLRLFVQVCDAVQHAHQKGIIHRDLKPSNILVTVIDGRAMPKVIDFGVAKATQQELTEKTVFTQFHHFIGTPAYVSPEQAQLTSQDIDTRSDIYSLGVLLYELLTGTTPFDTKELLSKGLDEMRRTIREVEPIKPSTRLTQERQKAQGKKGEIAQKGGKDRSEHSLSTSPLANAFGVNSQLSTDLDWIVMKCLEKDRGRRYETTNGLATDIQRHLSNEPIVARPPSSFYRFQKSVQRNKLAFAAASAVVVTLGLGVAASSLEAVRATRAERAQFRLREQAEYARNSEAVQRQRAEQSELVAQQNLYVADLSLAQRELDRGNLGAARTLLAAHRSLPAGKDLRGFEWRYLWGAARGDHFATLRGHSNVVTSVAVSPDGKLILSGSQDGTVRLWDLASQAEITTLPGFSHMVFSVAFSPDGKVFAVGSSAGVSLWNTERRELLYAAGRGAARVAFSPVGNLLAFGTSKTWSDRTGISVTLLDYPTGKEVRTFPEGGSRAAFSPDGRMLALAGRSDAVKLVDVASLKEVGALAHADTAISLAFSPDGSRLVVAYWGGETRVWDVAAQKAETSLNGHTARVWCTAFSPDKQTLATVSSDQTVRLWDLSTWQPKGLLRGHANEVWSVAFTPDGGTLVTGSKDETLMLSHLPSSLSAGGIVVGKAKPLISPNGLLLATASQPEQTVLQDLATTQRTCELEGSAAGFLDDGRILVTHATNGCLLFWDIAGRSIRSKTLLDDQQPIDWSVLSPNGRIWVARTQTGPLRFFDATSGKTLGVVLNHTEGPGTVAFSPDSSLVTTVQNGRLNLLEAASVRQVATDFKHKMLIEHCAFSPDGKLLATASADGTIVVREVPTMRELARLTSHKEGVCSVVFSPDGKTLVSSGDKSVKFWNVSTFRETITLVCKYQVDSLFFSEDGGLLALVSFGEPLKILRAPSFAEIAAAESAVAEKP